jgi:hypothetical protein
MSKKKQQVIQVLRNLANELENGGAPMGIALSWVIGQEDKSVTSGHFISFQHLPPQARTLLRGEVTRLLPLDDAMKTTPAVPQVIGGGPTLLN